MNLFTCEQLAFIGLATESINFSSPETFIDGTPITGVDVQIEEMDRLKYDRVEETGGWSEFEELATIYSTETK